MGLRARPRAGLSLAWITHAHLVRSPLFYTLLLAAALLIFATPYFTLFAFGQEAQSVREMGLATLTLWSLVLCLTLTGSIVTEELEDRTALSVFSKPVSRGGYLVAKFAGLCLALLTGLVFLGAILLLTLWIHFVSPELSGQLFQNHLREAGREADPESVYWEIVRGRFLAGELAIVGSAWALCVGQSILLAALSVTLGALLPSGATAATLVFAYLLVNMIDYVAAALSGAGPAASAVGEALRTALPNFGYLNLQAHLSESRPLSGDYICLAAGYVVLYCALVLGIGSAIFARREIR